MRNDFVDESLFDELISSEHWRPLWLCYDPQAIGPLASRAEEVIAALSDIARPIVLTAGDVSDALALYQRAVAILYYRGDSDCALQIADYSIASCISISRRDKRYGGLLIRFLLWRWQILLVTEDPSAIALRLYRLLDTLSIPAAFSDGTITLSKAEVEALVAADPGIVQVAANTFFVELSLAFLREKKWNDTSQFVRATTLAKRSYIDAHHRAIVDQLEAHRLMAEGASHKALEILVPTSAEGEFGPMLAARILTIEAYRRMGLLGDALTSLVVAENVLMAGERGSKNNKGILLWGHYNLAVVSCRMQEWAKAHIHFADALDFATEIRSTSGIAKALIGLYCVALRRRNEPMLSNCPALWRGQLHYAHRFVHQHRERLSIERWFNMNPSIASSLVAGSRLTTTEDFSDDSGTPKSVTTLSPPAYTANEHLLPSADIFLDMCRVLGDFNLAQRVNLPPAPGAEVIKTNIGAQSQRALGEAVSPTLFFANGIGDYIMMLPAIRALAYAFAGRLTLIGKSGAPWFLFEDLPLKKRLTIDLMNKDGMFWFDHTTLTKTARSSDLFISLNQWFSTPVLSLLRDLPFYATTIGHFSAFWIKHPMVPNRHWSENAYDCVRDIAPAPKDMSDFCDSPHLPEEAKQEAERYLRKNKIARPFITVHCDTVAHKCWTSTKWNFTLDSFLSDHPDFMAIVVGKPDKLIHPRLSSRVKHCSGLGLAAMFSLVNMSDIFIGIDSCFLHAADLCRTPAVALFGPTRFEHFGCLIGSHVTLQADGRMSEVRVEDVIDALESIHRVPNQRTVRMVGGRGD